MTTPTMTRTERRKAATRAALIDAGWRLLQVDEPSKIALQAITEEADLALGTFYNYFDDKDAFWHAMIDEGWERHRLASLELIEPSDCSANRIATALGVIVARAWMDRNWSRAMQSLYRNGLWPRPQHGASLEMMVAAEPESFPDYDTDFSVPSTLALLAGMLTGVAAPDFTSSLETTIRFTATAVLQTIGCRTADIAPAVDLAIERDPAQFWFD